ncbi:hypothetical protein MOMOMM089B2_13870 [Morganella morganii]
MTKAKNSIARAVGQKFRCYEKITALLQQDWLK